LYFIVLGGDLQALLNQSGLQGQGQQMGGGQGGMMGMGQNSFNPAMLQGN
jgi:hypothetical protein